MLSRRPKDDMDNKLTSECNPQSSQGMDSSLFAMFAHQRRLGIRVDSARARQVPAWIMLSVLLAALPLACTRNPPEKTKDSAESTETSEPKKFEFSVTPPIVAGKADIFEDVTDKAGIRFVQQYCDERISNILESNGTGAAILDFDKDGLMDIYIVNPGPLDGVTHHKEGTQREPNRLYRNRGDGTFEEVTEKAGVAGSGYSIAVAVGDYDNDGYPDIYVVNAGKNILYHNRGNGIFEDVTDKAGVGDKGTGIGATWVDVDGDGKLDLLVANYLTYDPNYKQYFNPDAYPGPLSYKPELNVLYRNKGDGTFEDISEKAGIKLPGHRAMSVCAFDYNGDGAPDIYLCNDATPNMLLLNDGKGHFQDIGLKAQVAFNALGEAAGSMTATIGDCNGDLLPDILVSRLGYGSLYMGASNGVCEDRMMASGIGPLTAQYVGWGSNFIDYDNDGNLDAFIANGDAHHMVGWESLLLRNQGNGTFEDAAEKGGAYFKTKIRARGSYILDYDNDGRMDVLVTAMGDRVFLLHNRDASGNHWLTLSLEGTQSNRDGFGARIKIVAGGKAHGAEARCQAGFLGTSDPRVHFGLGSAKTIDSIEIHWPSGAIQTLKNVAADQILKIKES
jgi:enediyne biosynthesis protein E4